MNSYARFIIVFTTFVVYWQTSSILADNLRYAHFGADSILYFPLAEKQIHDHVMLFHPMTGMLALGWMEVLGPLTAVMTPYALLNALFAAVGAASVWVASSGFAAIAPRRYVLPLVLIYASSLGIWYFASIAESKIITAFLSCLYVALYLHLRESWSNWRAAMLTVTLALACLNEIVSGLLAVIPAVDTVLRHGFSPRRLRWVVLHVVPVPFMLLVMELFINKYMLGPHALAAGSDHFSLFLTYVGFGDHSLSSLYNYILNWFAFSLAAPSYYAISSVDAWPDYYGYFEPSALGYFDSWVSMAAVLALAGLVALRLATPGQPLEWKQMSLVAALMTYSLLRGVVFFLFVPPEGLLYSSAVVMVHIIVLFVLLFTPRYRTSNLILLFVLAIGIMLSNVRFLYFEKLQNTPIILPANGS